MALTRRQALKTAGAAVAAAGIAKPAIAQSGPIQVGYLPALTGPSSSTGVGYTLAEMIDEGKPRIPIDAFSIGRFAGEVQPDAERLTGEFDAALASAAMRPRTETVQR